MLEIVLAGNKTEYAPGEHIEGTVRWGANDEPPDGLVVGLLYQTEGRGTQDTVHVDEVEVATLALTGEHNFRFLVPESPYTFDGTLISLRWYVEVSCSDETELKPVVVSPWVETVRLKEVKEPGVLGALAALKAKADQSQQQQQ